MQASTADAIVDRLTREHGELIGGRVLAACLGYRTERAFQLAARAGSLPVKTFHLNGRRGRFARTEHVARWLASLDA